MGLIVQSRDQEIFKFVYEYGFVTAGQIKEAIFPKNDPVTCRVRLSELVRHEYLKRFPYDLTCYKLTRKGMGEIYDVEVDPDHYLKLRYPKFYLKHDMGLVDCSLILRTSPVISYWIPRCDLGRFRYDYGYISNEGYRVPDAMFDVRIDGQKLRFALEYELSRKSKKRYRNIFEAYFFENKIDAVCYLAISEHLKKTILAIADSIEYSSDLDSLVDKNKIYVATISDFLKFKLDTHFEGLNEKHICFSKLAQKSLNPGPNMSENRV